MNFLAHCALADDAATHWSVTAKERTGLLAGAVIGDFCKGTIAVEWPTALRAGVRLHRKIDALSNRHPAITKTCNRFPKGLRRFAPIFVDILADYWLSLDWAAHHQQDIERFSVDCYEAIHGYRSFLDNRGQSFFEYMRREDLLAHHDDWHHVEQALRSVLRRLDKSNEFDHINAQMQSVVDSGAGEFLQYYPELGRQLQSWNAFEASASAALRSW